MKKMIFRLGLLIVGLLMGSSMNVFAWNGVCKPQVGRVNDEGISFEDAYRVLLQVSRKAEYKDLSISFIEVRNTYSDDVDKYESFKDSLRKKGVDVEMPSIEFGRIAPMSTFSAKDLAKILITRKYEDGKFFKSEKEAEDSLESVYIKLSRFNRMKEYYPFIVIKGSCWRSYNTNTVHLAFNYYLSDLYRKSLYFDRNSNISLPDRSYGRAYYEITQITQKADSLRDYLLKWKDRLQQNYLSNATKKAELDKIIAAGYKENNSSYEDYFTNLHKSTYAMQNMASDSLNLFGLAIYERKDLSDTQKKQLLYAICKDSEKGIQSSRKKEIDYLQSYAKDWLDAVLPCTRKTPTILSLGQDVEIEDGVYRWNPYNWDSSDLDLTRSFYHYCRYRAAEDSLLLLFKKYEAIGENVEKEKIVAKEIKAIEKERGGLPTTFVGKLDLFDEGQNRLKEFLNKESGLIYYKAVCDVAASIPSISEKYPECAEVLRKPYLPLTNGYVNHYNSFVKYCKLSKGDDEEKEKLIAEFRRVYDVISKSKPKFEPRKMDSGIDRLDSTRYCHAIYYNDSIMHEFHYIPNRSGFYGYELVHDIYFRLKDGRWCRNKERATTIYSKEITREMLSLLGEEKKYENGKLYVDVGGKMYLPIDVKGQFYQKEGLVERKDFSGSTSRFINPKVMTEKIGTNINDYVLANGTDYTATSGPQTFIEALSEEDYNKFSAYANQQHEKAEDAEESARLAKKKADFINKYSAYGRDQARRLYENDREPFIGMNLNFFMDFYAYSSISNDNNGNATLTIDVERYGVGRRYRYYFRNYKLYKSDYYSY